MLIDAYGPGNSRSSSGDESRIIRMGYGADEIYTRSALRSLQRWKELARRMWRTTFSSDRRALVGPRRRSLSGENLRDAGPRGNCF